MRRNLRTSLRAKPRPRPMERYDRLPAELRLWLATAALPWSPHSAAKLWARLGRETGGDLAQMLKRLDQAEQRLLSRDAPGIWGRDYPAAPAGSRHAQPALAGG